VLLASERSLNCGQLLSLVAFQTHVNWHGSVEHPGKPRVTIPTSFPTSGINSTKPSAARIQEFEKPAR
jgi:hypothetical protein